MTSLRRIGLLVSVRSANEALLALAGGAALIDVKEPGRGSLGYSNPAVWREVQAAIASRVPTSAALGELLTDPVETLAAQAAGFAYAKIGLAGCGSEPLWREKWLSALRCLPQSVAPVAVAYADWEQAQAPRPAEVLRVAMEFSVAMLLVDTWDKRGGRLLDQLPLEQLAQLARDTERAEIGLVLAGSLTMEMLPQLLPLHPQYVAVRGAVCRGKRTDDIDARLVAEYAGALRAGEKFARPNKGCSETVCTFISAPKTA